MRIALYVSGHGFGHATRQVALMEEIAKRSKVEFLLRTEAPSALFKEAGIAFELESDRFDVGMIQKSALVIDMPATLRSHRAIIADFDARVDRERSRLIQFAPDLVLSDCGPLPIEAAAALGIPAYTIGNFTWDWILEEYVTEDPRWAPIVRRYAQAYGKSESYWRLPLHGDDGNAFSHTRDFGHLVRRPRLNKNETLKALGLHENESRRIVTVAFGGFQTKAFAGDDPDIPENVVFVGFTDPPPGFAAPWIKLPQRSPISTVDLARVSSVLIGKLGYGTVAECLDYGVRMMYVPRPGNREIRFMERAIAGSDAFRKIPAEDFFAARWRPCLNRILEVSDPVPVPGSGAADIADAVMQRMGVS